MSVSRRLIQEAPFFLFRPRILVCSPCSHALVPIQSFVLPYDWTADQRAHICPSVQIHTRNAKVRVRPSCFARTHSSSCVAGGPPGNRGSTFFLALARGSRVSRAAPRLRAPAVMWADGAVRRFASNLCLHRSLLSPSDACDVARRINRESHRCCSFEKTRITDALMARLSV